MTEVNGLRLAYRGFVAGLAGGYVWMAIAMALSGAIGADPLSPLRPIALAITPLADSPELAFVLGLLAVQTGGALVGMVFAYFFARFFTVHATLRLAAPIVAILAWALMSPAVVPDAPAADVALRVVPLVATLGYGLLIGWGVPTRGEVTRQAAA